MFSFNSTILRLLKILTNRQRKNLFILISLMVIGGVLEIIGIGTILPIMYIFSDQNKLKEFGIMQFFSIFGVIKIKSIIIILFILLLFFYLFKIVYITYLTWRQNGFISQLQQHLSSFLFQGYLKMPYSFHYEFNSNDLMHNVRNVVIQFCSSVLSILTALTELITLFSISILLLVYDPFGTILVLFIFLIFSFLLSKITNYKINIWGIEQNLHDKKRTFFLQQGLTGIKEVKAAGIEQKFIDYYNESNYIHTKAGQKFQTIQAIPRLFLEFILILAVLGLIFILNLRNLNFISIITELSIFAASAFRILPSINKIINSVQNIKFTKNNLNILEKELLQINNNNKSIKEEEITNWENLDLLSIYIKKFNYKKNETIILQNLNLNILNGDSIGIVGESGAGKSTLLDIIMGLHKIEHGYVKLNSIDISNNYAMWQKHIGYVPQSVFLLDDTIKNNIVFGSTNNIVDTSALNEAIRLASLEEFISNLENGLDTLVGESGIRLSGGQKQRIGIARALYRKPNLLVLDESTSALDLETEKYVIDSIEGLFGKKTIIIVSHRLSAIKNCNKIFKIENGNLEEYKLTSIDIQH